MTLTIRGVLKATGWTLGGLFLVLLMFVGLLAFPAFMFAHEVKHANITIHTDEDLSADLEPVLREIHTRIAASRIDAPVPTTRFSWVTTRCCSVSCRTCGPG
jgi:hypothetical protein